MPGTILFGIDVETANENSVGFAKHAVPLFGELEVPVTWYLTGRTLERYPDVFKGVDCSDLIDLQAHTYSHLLLKTVLMRVPEGKCIHGKTDWFMKRGGSLQEIEDDLARCQEVFTATLGRRATALTGPWGYYRGLGDRPDILEIVHRLGFRALRTFARNEWDGQPTPLEWQPFFYDVQGFPDVLECPLQGYQDDYCWRTFTEASETENYADHLKTLADRVAAEDLTWGLCSHDHHCGTKEGFDEKGVWYREILEHAKGLGIRFLTVSRYYEEMLARKGRT